MVAVKAEKGGDGAVGCFQNASQWTGRYQRNNKRSGLKNLRCFPYCSDAHRLRGFCGREVVLQSQNADSSPLYSWAEFCKVGDDESPASSKGGKKKISVGDEVSASDVAQRARTKTDAFKPWYIGEPVGGEESRTSNVVSFEYNKAKKGWNYGWVANKHTCDSLHVLRAYVFKRLPSGSFKCLGIVDSPEFTLFCRRRQRHNLANLPAHLKEQLKTEEANRKRKSSLANAEGSDGESSGGKVPLVPKKRFRTEMGGDGGAGEGSSEGSETGSQGRGPLSQEKRDDLLWRLIQSLMKLDFDERKSGLAEGPNKSVSAGRVQSEVQQPVANDPGFDDFIEALLPTFDEEALDFDTMSLGNDLEPLFVDLTGDLTDFTSNQLFCKENVLEELARFMIDENNFTQAIEQVLSGTKDKNLSVEQQRRMLLDVFAENIDVFLQRLCMSLEDLDRLLSPSRSSTTLVEKVSKQISLYSRAKPRKAFCRNSGLFPNVSGKWRRTQETLDIMDSIRHQCGLPWIIRKVLIKMERDFELHLTKHTLDYRIPKKLMFNGMIQYKLDGKEHAYTLGSILPRPDNQDKKTKKPFKPTYIAYAEGRRIILIKNLDFNKRMWRSVRVNHDGQKLISTISFQEKSESSDWVSKGMWRGIAEKVP